MDLGIVYKVEADTCKPADVANVMTEAMNKASAEGWAVHDTSLAVERYDDKAWYHWVIVYVRDVDETELSQLST